MHFNHSIIIMGKERTNKHIKKRRQEKAAAAAARGEKNALRKFNKISKLQKLRNSNNNSITSIDPNLQPMSVDNKTNNNNLADLHGSGSGQVVMSPHQQRIEQLRRIRSSKVANIPYSVLPQPYNVCRRTTNMNALQMHNYIETLRGEYAPGKKFERKRTFENRSKCSRTFGFSSTNK